MQPNIVKHTDIADNLISFLNKAKKHTFLTYK